METPIPSPTSDVAFDIVLKSSGRTFTVPASKSILDVLIEAGIDPMFDCMRGECGVCQVGIIEGEADHRDVILSASERATNKVMQICVSRAKSPRLVLDL
jgi:vanillate O-demethylase ferredoxin subunit